MLLGSLLQRCHRPSGDHSEVEAVAGGGGGGGGAVAQRHSLLVDTSCPISFDTMLGRFSLSKLGHALLGDAVAFLRCSQKQCLASATTTTTKSVRPRQWQSLKLPK